MKGMGGARLHKQIQTNKNISPDVSSVIATLDYFYPLSEGIKNFFCESIPIPVHFVKENYC